MTCDTCLSTPCTCESDVVALPAAPRFEPIVHSPYADRAPEFRASHRDELRAVATWALASGRAVDLDAIAFVVETFGDVERREQPLSRPLVDWLINGAMYNVRTMWRVEFPERRMEHAWTYVHFLAETGRLPEGSDPLPVLLEPLQCYGGLGPDGRERPEGTDVDFFCQCKIPHDPSVPEGMVQVILGYREEEPHRLLATGYGHQRSADHPRSIFAPLIALSRRAREDALLDVPVYIDEFRPHITIPANRWTPTLHLYAFEHDERGTLVLDDEGNPWEMVIDRRRKLGYRWKRMRDVRGALWRAGYMRHQFDRERRLRAEFEAMDWDDDLLPDAG